MSDDKFKFVRLIGEDNKKISGVSLSDVCPNWAGCDMESFLFVSPHDDDVIIGGGLMMLAAVAENISTHVAVVTDGAQGYCSLEEKDTISDIRKQETFDSCQTLGVDAAKTHWLGFPDCQLGSFQGRRPAADGDPAASFGYTGLQHALVELIRKVRPTRICLPTNTDYHPDHRLVHSELMISIFHATGDIWPELGTPLETVPEIYELAIYCNYPEAPKLRITACREEFEKKLSAIMQFKSQKQIASMVESIRKTGPVEYIRPVEFKLYNPADYANMFD